VVVQVRSLERLEPGPESVALPFRVVCFYGKSLVYDYTLGWTAVFEKATLSHMFGVINNVLINTFEGVAQ
jgi:hypothetical protein